MCGGLISSSSPTAKQHSLAAQLAQSSMVTGCTWTAILATMSTGRPAAGPALLPHSEPAALLDSNSGSSSRCLVVIAARHLHVAAAGRSSDGSRRCRGDAGSNRAAPV